jgi:hypothetical protein
MRADFWLGIRTSANDEHRKGDSRQWERAGLLGYTITGTLTVCDPYSIPSTSHWTGAAITV